MTARDPYQYFRIEARELVDGLARAFLALERAPDRARALAEALRLAHTLKGAAGVVGLARIAERAHALEDLLAALRDAAGRPGAPAAVDAALVDELLEHLDAVRAEVAALDPPPAVGAGPARAGPARAGSARAGPPAAAHDGPAAPRDEDDAAALLRVLRVPIEELDAVAVGVAQGAVTAEGLNAIAAGLTRARASAGLVADRRGARSQAGDGAEELERALVGLERRLTEATARLRRELAEVQARADRLRLVPAATVFPELERAVRDTARSLGREATFRGRGGDERVEAHVLSLLRGALGHLVRNAVAHGVEDPHARRAAGKEGAGRIEVVFARRGPQVAVCCRDDGRGIDLEAVRGAAVARGLLTAGEAAALDAREAARLVLHPGLTTAGGPTLASGRGVGLDVVHEAVRRLKGDLTIQSEAGVGTTLELLVPVSATSIETLSLEAGGQVVALPAAAVAGVRRVSPADLLPGSPPTIVLGDRALPFAPLRELLGLPAPPDGPQRPWAAVLLRLEEGEAALGADRVGGTRRDLVGALPPAAQGVPLLLGATLDAEGNPRLILDPAALLRAACAWGGGAGDAGAPAAPHRILVVDDSLTTRMLEQTILEASGYEVDLASSAEEGLEMARARPYALFLVDVEMPGLNGFEFVARTRADPALAGTPAVLVTTRDAAEDRRRGFEAGARGYLLKGEFDEERLLGTVRDLIGAGG